MKKTFKKTLAAILAVMMVIPTIMVATVSADTTQPDSIIAVENFDNYTGNLADDTRFTLVTNAPGSSVTVAEDSLTGSKALKITQTRQAGGGTALTGLQVKLNDISSGIIDIKFKMREEGKHTATLHENLIDAVSDWNGDYPVLKIMKFLNTELYMENWSGFLCNANETYKEYTITADIATDSISISTDSKTLTYNYGDLKALRTMNFLISAEHYNNEYYTDTNVDTTATNDPIYWIDDISVTKRAVEVVSMEKADNVVTVAFNEEIADACLSTHFEVTKDGLPINVNVAKSETDAKKVEITLPDEFGTFNVKVNEGVTATNTGVLALASAYEKAFLVKAETVILSEDFETTTTIENISIAEGDTVSSVTVEEDEKGSRAAKIVIKEGTTTNTGFDLFFTPVSSGKMKVSYKMRPENTSARLNYWAIGHYYPQNGWTYDSAGSKFVQYQDTLYTDATANNPPMIANIANSDVYKQFDYYVDVDNGNYDVYVDGILKEENRAGGFTSGTWTKGANMLRFNASFDVGNLGTSFLPTRGGNAVYWVDDISVETYNYPEIIASSVKNGQVNVALDSALTYTFDRDLVDSTLTDNVIVKKNGTVVDSCSVSYADKVVTINGLTLSYDESYTVTFKKAIATATDSMKADATFSFRTESDPDATIGVNLVNSDTVAVSDITEYAGKTVYVKGKVNEEKNYMLVVVLKDANGKLVSVNSVMKADVTDGVIDLSLVVPSNVTEDFKVEGFLWEADTLKPLTDAKLDLYSKKN